MTNLDKVREALEHIEEYWNRDHNSDAITDALWHILETTPVALSALSAHEEEVAELVEVAKKFATGAVGHYDFDALTAALRPFEDKK